MNDIITNTPNQHKKTCFVITPIGKENEPIRRHVDGIVKAVIEPVLEETDFEPIVPHYMTNPGSIDKQIIKQIYKSDLVIANLTNVNPNVMYELALRHCFGTPLIIIAEDGTILPFDIGNQRTIFYHNDAMGVLTLKTDLTKAIKKLSDDETYESPVISVVKELGIEEIIIKDKTINSNKNEANAWGLLFERLDRLEQRIITPGQQGFGIGKNTLPSDVIQRKIMIIGEKPIDYRVRNSLRLLLNSIQTEYKMETSYDDTKILIDMQYPTNQKWKHFFNAVTDICTAYKLTVKDVVYEKMEL